jgi:hypothetical protein
MLINQFLGDPGIAQQMHSSNFFGWNVDEATNFQISLVRGAGRIVKCYSSKFQKMLVCKTN